MQLKQALLLLLIVSVILLFFGLDFDHAFRLDQIKLRFQELNSYVMSQPIHAKGLFLLSLIMMTCCALPVAAIMSIIGGALFGLLWGSILASVGTVIGGSLCFLSSRYIFSGLIAKRDIVQHIDRQIEQGGRMYLLSVRLIPVFPFPMINLLFGLTKLKLTDFILMTWLGMLPIIIIFNNAGVQLIKLTSMADILSFNIILSLTLIGLLPLISHLVKQRRQTSS